ncbi:MAG TPA: V-type ATPase subunit [Bacillota bacterium]|nr:V-type ATPase subunit [Bacillota bacterium]
MSSFAGNAIITKAKSLYGKRLRPEDYEELLKFNSVPEIVGYLKKHDKYSNTLQDVTEYSMHRGQLEDLIKKSYFDNLTRLVKFVSTSDKKFYELDMIRREIEIVLSSIRSIISGNIESSIRDLPMFFRQHASFDIEELSKSLSMKSLMSVLQGTRYYDLLLPFYTDDPSEIRFTDIEHSLYVKYHEIVLERINKFYKGKLHKQLMDIYQSKVEVENVIKIYRLKKFYHANEMEIMNTLITKDIRMSDSKLKELINLKDPDDILDVLSRSEYSVFKSDEDDYIYIEYLAGRIKYNLAKRYMYFSNYPPIVYAVYLFLNEIEQSNIFNIIEGVRYDIKQEDIKKMLIY